MIPTVTGEVDPADLGPTLIHEHVRFRDEALAINWPSRYDDAAEEDAAVEELQRAKARGVTSIADPTAMFGGRDVELMRRASERSGVRVVACTGIYTYDHLPHYFDHKGSDRMAELFVEDIERGIQGTDIRAGFIKCAADTPGITKNVEKVHRAAARASLQTGAPIIAHSSPAAGTGPLQADIFIEEGVDPARIQIAHTGDTDDLTYIEKLLDMGVWIGLDRYGLNSALPHDRRNATTAELIRRGHAGRIHLSQDYCPTLDWFSPNARAKAEASGALHGWSMTLVHDEVLPWLHEQGVLDEQTERTILVDNPRAFLSPRG